MKVPIDLTSVGEIPAGPYVATVQNLTLQVKTGEKWNKDGTMDVQDHSEFFKYPVEQQRLHYQLFVPGKGGLWHDLYLTEKSLGFAKAFMRACGVAFDKDGFDPFECIGKQVGIDVVSEQAAGYEPRSVIAKTYRV